MKTRIRSLTKEELAYIAGFTDGDGSIFAQLVYRFDYRLKYQIRTTISFTQKTSRLWFLKKLQEKLGCGIFRDRKDGVCELSLVGFNNVKALLKALLPFLVIQKPVALLVLEIIESLSKDQSVNSFIKSCELVDRVAHLTDSKNRKITTETVRNTLFPS